MKLYATVTSERASKGQGGNNFLDVALLVGDARTQREVVRLKTKVYQDKNGEDCFAVYGTWHGATEAEKILYTGYLLKDERVQCTNCLRPFDGMEGKEDTCPNCLRGILKGENPKA